MEIIVSHIFHLISVCFYFRRTINAHRNLRKITSAESKSIANKRERLQAIPEEEEEEAERPQRPNTMEDF